MMSATTEVQVEIYFAAVDVYVRYLSFQYTMSPQRKPPQCTRQCFSNERPGSLDPVMTKNDLTDEEIPLTGPPTQHRCALLSSEIL